MAHWLRSTTFFMPFFVTALVLFTGSRSLAAGFPFAPGIQALLGKQSFHDGPNCYNAAAFALGFTDRLYQSSESELKYYVTEFCRERKSTPQPGDLLMVSVEPENFDRGLAHVAILIDEKTIFEKGSLTGLHGFFSDKQNAFYVIRPLAESSDGKNCIESPEKCRAYTCNPHSTLALAKKRRCESAPGFERIKQIRTELERISFLAKSDVSDEIEKLAALIDGASREITEIDLQDECGLFYLVSWNSIEWHLASSLAQEYSSKNSIRPETSELRERFRSASERARQILKDPASRYILSVEP